ncbi:MAG: YdiU family protein [Gemmatimonadetes bacterium]|nr:YdiU family protein [Gemmatimonadota bacterium]MDA1103181.1 YdiU family protein [Gemmatimonadota bacterium]
MIRPDTFLFDNSYAAELEGFYVPWQGAKAPEPRIVQLNRDLAAELLLDPDALAGEGGAAIFAGSDVPAGAAPLAQAYAGHQFGGFSPQLGDGRALLIGELIDRHGVRRDLQLKGSGRTPFSRGGDGKAVLGPVLREYLIGEAMHALGVPTTRALAAVTTGDRVLREGLEPGAVLARVAASHLRVGTFEFFSAREETEKVRQLADYAIRRHFPELADQDDRYLAMFREVRDRQADLVAQWMAIGFVHGVMNTDNMAIAGETLDYGPCAFIDGYDRAAVYSSIDHRGRYAYGNQPAIAQWNLARLVETLLPLLDPDDGEHAIAVANTEIEAFEAIYQKCWLERMSAKLGLARTEADDLALVTEVFRAMDGQDVDFTVLFCRLADAARGDSTVARALFADPTAFDAWLPSWLARLEREDGGASSRAAAMDRVNPVYIPRNHKVQEALDAATAGNLEPFQRLLTVLERPFDRREGLDEYEGRAPDGFGPYRTFCGT